MSNTELWREWLNQLRSNVRLDRCEAAEAPPESGDAHEIVVALIPLLDDADHLVRLAAAESLGLYPDPAALVPLREYVRREADPLARAYGLSSLGLIGDEQDIAYLVSAGTGQSEGIDRVHGLLGLYELVRRVAIRRLMVDMAAGSDSIRTSAAGALAQIVKTPQLAEVVQAMEEQLSKEETANSRAYFEGFLKTIVNRP